MYVTIPTEAFNQISTQATPTLKTGPIARDLKSGTVLYDEGDEAKRVYEVVSGVLRLTRVMENGRRQVIAFGYPGDIVGFPNGNEYHTECDVLSNARVIAHRRETLENGDAVTIIKDLKVKGSSSVLKVGTKVKDIRLVDGDHNIDCKIEGIGGMKLKSEFVKKVHI